jgi:hypothetical protein
MNSISSLFASKSRKAQFEVQVTVETLTDVPLIDGRFFAKWKVGLLQTFDNGLTIIR